MAAIDTFDDFNAKLSLREREILRECIRNQREDLFAARSEDARLRIVQTYIGWAHERLNEVK